MSDGSTRRFDPAGWLIEKVRRQGFEWVFRRYYGMYRGVVIDTEDPDSRGRIRVRVPGIGQTTDDEVSPNTWALPCADGMSVGTTKPHGMFYPPDVGDHVWVQFEHGLTSYPVYMGGFWIQHDGTEFDQKNALYKGFRTKSGHYLRMSDDSDGDDLHLTIAHGDGDGAQDGALISLQHDGSILISSSDGAHVWLNTEEKTISIIGKDGTNVAIGEDAVSMMTKSGASISLKEKGLEISCSGDITLTSGGQISLNAGAVAVGNNATEPAVKGQALMTHLSTHLHPTTAPGAPTVVPSGAPLMKYNELSSVVTMA